MMHVQDFIGAYHHLPTLTYLSWLDLHRNLGEVSQGSPIINCPGSQQIRTQSSGSEYTTLGSAPRQPRPVAPSDCCPSLCQHGHPPRPRRGGAAACVPLSVSFAGDAPFCTPEQHKECAEPALGQYWGTDGVMETLETSGCGRETEGKGDWRRVMEKEMERQRRKERGCRRELMPVSEDWAGHPGRRRCTGADRGVHFRGNAESRGRQREARGGEMDSGHQRSLAIHPHTLVVCMGRPRLFQSRLVFAPAPRGDGGRERGWLVCIPRVKTEGTGTPPPPAGCWLK